MGDLAQYWREVRELERSLPQFVWLMSVEDAKRGMVGGRMAEVGAEQAAQLLLAKSHRRATEEETVAYREQEDQSRRQSFHEGLRRRGIAVVPMPAVTSPEADGKRATTKRR